MQQVLAIHGGTSFDTYDEYLEFLKTREITPERLAYGRGWKESLQDDLGQDYQVFLPKMPNGANAKYLEWKIWFERCSELLQDGVILIGHSLGGVFLAKYLSENNYPSSIRATMLVAAPFEDTDTVESLKEFALPNSLELFARQGGKVYLLHSKDDPVVPFSEIEKYQQALPQATPVAFEDKQHFNHESFPEIVDLIKNL